MTAKAVLCRFLLEGRVLNVHNCFREVSLTNIAREITRMVEKPFGVIVSRTPMVGKNRYKQPTHYVNYRLNVTEMNAEGRAKMWEYVTTNWGDRPPKKPVGRPATEVPKITQTHQTLF